MWDLSEKEEANFTQIAAANGWGSGTYMRHFRDYWFECQTQYVKRANRTQAHIVFENSQDSLSRKVEEFAIGLAHGLVSASELFLEYTLVYRKEIFEATKKLGFELGRWEKDKVLRE